MLSSPHVYGTTMITPPTWPVLATPSAGSQLGMPYWSGKIKINTDLYSVGGTTLRVGDIPTKTLHRNVAFHGLPRRSTKQATQETPSTVLQFAIGAFVLLLSEQSAVRKTPASATYQRFAWFISPDGRYRLSVPITIQISDADGDGIFVVSDGFSTVYGAGETPAEAREDYKHNLFAHFDELEEDEANLGGGLQRELQMLRRYIVKT